MWPKTKNETHKAQTDFTTQRKTHTQYVYKLQNDVKTVEKLIIAGRSCNFLSEIFLRKIKSNKNKKKPKIVALLFAWTPNYKFRNEPKRKKCVSFASSRKRRNTTEKKWSSSWNQALNTAECVVHCASTHLKLNNMKRYFFSFGSSHSCVCASFSHFLFYCCCCGCCCCRRRAYCERENEARGYRDKNHKYPHTKRGIFFLLFVRLLRYFHSLHGISWCQCVLRPLSIDVFVLKWLTAALPFMCIVMSCLAHNKPEWISYSALLNATQTLDTHTHTDGESGMYRQTCTTARIHRQRTHDAIVHVRREATARQRRWRAIHLFCHSFLIHTHMHNHRFTYTDLRSLRSRSLHDYNETWSHHIDISHSML